MIGGERVLPELHRRVGFAAGHRIDEADGFHRAEAQRVVTTVRHHLDWQAALEEAFLVEVMHRCRLRPRERVVEAVVFFTRQRTIQIIAVGFARTARRCRGAETAPPA